MTRHLVQYVSAVVVLVVVDAVWLGVISRGFTRAQIGPLLREDILWLAAVAFYLIYAAGLVVFAVAPAVRAGDLLVATGYGALLGVVAYATYDLSNLATLKGFTTAFALVDIAWGTALSAITATAAAWISLRLAG